MEERCVVSIEGIAYEYNNYEEAVCQYERLKNGGYHEAILKIYSPLFIKPMMYNDKAHCLISA